MMPAESAPSDFSRPMPPSNCSDSFATVLSCSRGGLSTRAAFRLPSSDSPLIFCSNPAITGDGSALMPYLAAPSVQRLSMAHETVRHLLTMPPLPTDLLFERRQSQCMNFFCPGCLLRCWGGLSFILWQKLSLFYCRTHIHINLSFIFYLRCNIIALAPSQPRSPFRMDGQVASFRPAQLRSAIQTSGHAHQIKPCQSRCMNFLCPLIAVPDQWIRIRTHIIMATMPFLSFACPPVAVLAILNLIPDTFYCGLRANTLIQITTAIMPNHSSSHRAI